MSRELWAVEKCEHDEFDEHWECGGPEAPLVLECVTIGSDCGHFCPGGSEFEVDFDAIWTRYYEAADRRNQPGLTEDELRKVIGLDPEGDT